MRAPVLSLMAGLMLLAPPHRAEATGPGHRAPEKPLPAGVYSGGGRTGGDTVNDPTLIPGLPFSDTGNTCGFANDYDEVCPYSGSTAPDVVYRFDPDSDIAVDLDLCASGYDTKVYIFQDGPGNLVTCNDDAGCGYSGYQSKLQGILLPGGHAYYVMVDGYGPSCGDYALEFREHIPCVVPCPPGGWSEGEPPCADDQEDHYNGGCNSDPHVFQPLGPAEQYCVDLCGESCTYLYGGLSYRDTDWFTARCYGGGLVTATCTAEFPLQLMFVFAPTCDYIEYEITWAEPCQPATLDRYCTADQEVWFWVGPSVFTGVPPSNYVLSACGIGPYQSPLGACCDPLYAGCILLTQQFCGDDGGIFLGQGTTCNPDPCYGGCCAEAGCLDTDWHDCVLDGGNWHFQVPCAESPCPPPVPAERTSWGRVKSGYR